MRLLIVALLFLALAGRASVGDASITVIPGDTVVSTLAASGADRYEIYVPSAAALDLRGSAVAGLEIGLGIVGPDGATIDIARYIKGAPGRRPTIRGLPIARPGVYTVHVIAASGLGTYSMKSRLRARKPVTVDLRTATSDAEILRLPASRVELDRTGTPLSTTNVQDLAVQLDARATAAEQAQIALSARVTSVEGAVSLARLPGLRVAARSAAGQSFTSDAVTIVTPSTYSFPATIVKRASVARATFGPGEMQGPVVALVTWSVHQPNLNPISSGDVNLFAVWAEVGSKRVVGRTLTNGGPEFMERVVGASADDAAYFDALGLGPIPTTNVTTRTHLVVYQPTDQERASGFAFDVLLSASASRTADVPSFTIAIESACILAD